MKIFCIPLYCGGRFLSGLYNPQAGYSEPGVCWQNNAANWMQPETNIQVIDTSPYLPYDFVEFLQILRKFNYADRGRDGYQGVIYAVTNPQQNIARNYLKDAGFDQAGIFNKGAGNSDCITWIGDYRHKIYPILSKVPNYTPKSEVKSESKFKTSAQPQPEPTTPAVEQFQAWFGLSQPAPSSDSLRNRAQQTLSTRPGR